jgi:hypothetical protein
MAQVSDSVRSLAGSIVPALGGVFDTLIDCINDIADGSIATDELSITGDLTVGDDINFEGATGVHDIVLADNKADALSFVIAGGGNDMIVFKTTDSDEQIRLAAPVAALESLSVGNGAAQFVDGNLLAVIGPVTGGASSTRCAGLFLDFHTGQELTATTGSNEISAIHCQTQAIINFDSTIFASLFIGDSEGAASSSQTVTNVAAIYIASEPQLTNITATNGPYAIFVDAGESRFDGGIRGPAASSPRMVHTGGRVALATTDGVNAAANVAGTVYLAECFVPCNMSVTGAAHFNGTAVAGNMKLMLYDSSGTRVAITADTAVGSATSYTSIAFTGGPIAVVGPGSYWLGAIYSDTTHDLRSHVLGAFGAGTDAGNTYATDSTFATVTIPTTFTTGTGPIMSLY